ncbi:MAG: GtrA family protein [Acetatifactor sp.]|nr:GtrA family protein [Acetatifactor sp.]
MIEKIKSLMKKYEEAIAYLIVGGCTTIVSWGAMYLASWLLFGNPLHPTPFQNAVMSTVNWVAGVIFAYFTNRRFVFKSHEPMGKEIPKFVLSRVSTFVLELVIRQIFGLLGINTYVTTFVAAVLVFLGNYILSKLLVFKPQKESET